MKPGATINPEASINTSALDEEISPIASILPSFKATSPLYHGFPVPSIIKPFFITILNI